MFFVLYLFILFAEFFVKKLEIVGLVREVFLINRASFCWRSYWLKCLIFFHPLKNCVIFLLFDRLFKNHRLISSSSGSVLLWNWNMPMKFQRKTSEKAVSDEHRSADTPLDVCMAFYLPFLFLVYCAEWKEMCSEHFYYECWSCSNIRFM